MPEPAFALFFFFHSFVTSPTLYGRCAVLGLEKLLFPPLYIVQTSVKVARHYILSLALVQLFSRFLSLPLARSVTPLHNSLLPTRTNPLPTSVYDQLCYISKI